MDSILSTYAATASKTMACRGHHAQMHGYIFPHFLSLLLPVGTAICLMSLPILSLTRFAAIARVVAPGADPHLLIGLFGSAALTGDRRTCQDEVHLTMGKSGHRPKSFGSQRQALLPARYPKLLLDCVAHVQSHRETSTVPARHLNTRSVGHTQHGRNFVNAVAGVFWRPLSEPTRQPRDHKLRFGSCG